MRKYLFLPSVAILGGAGGFALRRWDRAVAFEPETGLVIPNMPSTLALLGLTALVALVLALLCRGKHRPFTKGYDQAFAARGNTLYITAMVLSALLVLGGGVLQLLEGINDLTGQMQLEGGLSSQMVLSLFPRFLLTVLCVCSCFCAISTGKNNYRGEGRGKYSFMLLSPAYMACMWLIVAYQARAADPVILDYLYELFAIIACLLGLYFTAGFAFERAKVFRSSYFSLLGVYFSLVTLADGHTLSTTLLYAFAVLSLLASTMALLFNDGLPEPRSPRPQEVPEDYDMEVFPDEQG